MKQTAIGIGVALFAAALSMPARAVEHRIGGAPILKDGMIVSAVYLQPVDMQPAMPGMSAAGADIHLEADIHANKDNAQGFDGASWIPYLTIDYKLTRNGSNWSTSGKFVPMVANDGPHYGANVKLDGPGKYHLSYHVLPPSYAGFYRHTDKETGVAAWWAPFTVGWDFVYTGVGKKGGY